MGLAVAARAARCDPCAGQRSGMLAAWTSCGSGGARGAGCCRSRWSWVLWRARRCCCCCCGRDASGRCWDGRWRWRGGRGDGWRGWRCGRCGRWWCWSWWSAPLGKKPARAAVVGRCWCWCCCQRPPPVGLDGALLLQNWPMSCFWRGRTLCSPCALPRLHNRAHPVHSMQPSRVKMRAVSSDSPLPLGPGLAHLGLLLVCRDGGRRQQESSGRTRVHWSYC